MMLYYQSWMFYIHFIATLYHFLGLTYWHSAQCQLLFFACFLVHRISIPNGVQMPQNFLEIFFWTKDTQGAKEVHERRPMGPTRHQGVPEAPGVPWWVVGPTRGFSTTSQLYKYSDIPETLGESPKHNSSCRKFQNHEIQSRALFRHLAGGEHDHGGFIILIGSPPMMRE